MSPETKRNLMVAGAGAVAALGVTIVGVVLKVRALGTPEARQSIERQIERVANAEADRYLGAAWGMTPDRLATISRLSQSLSSIPAR